MNINKYPEILPGKKLFKRVYVAIMLWTVGKAVQVAAKIDKEVKAQIAKLPNNFTLRMMVAPEKAFPLFFYAKMLPSFVTDKGLLLYGIQMFLHKDKEGKLTYIGADPKGKKVDLSIIFTSIEAAWLVLSFQESTATAYMHGRFVVEGDLPHSLTFVRVLDIVETFLLPKIIVKLAVKRYPKWSEMSPIRKFVNRILIYLRAFTIG
jgi:hypothetical protein